ncbi:hypothetical protein ACGFX8_36425 [Streptomyces sp. NPDC048362]|uniref:hypothetical protein n=1 Tax=Streptomyces sp. NPDC048362 TaxID=3365539 RepID=UPI00371CF2B3
MRISNAAKETNKTTDVYSASDLWIWLIGNPTPPDMTPMGWANPTVLCRVLRQLKATDEGIVEYHQVWETLRMSVESPNSSYDTTDDDLSYDETWAWNPGTPQGNEQESTGDEEDLSSSEEDWPEGEWFSDDFGKQPAQFRLDLPSEEIERRKTAMKAKLSGYNLLGFHGTRASGLGSLVTFGPVPGRIGTGSGVGKGEGFYVHPVNGDHMPYKALPMAKALSSSSEYGAIVAVYIDKRVKFTLGDMDNIATDRVSVWGGGGEATIPEELFDKVKIVRNVDDFSMAFDPRYRTIPYTGADRSTQGVSWYVRI